MTIIKLNSFFRLMLRKIETFTATCVYVPLHYYQRSVHIFLTKQGFTIRPCNRLLKDITIIFEVKFLPSLI